jgi:ribosomal protein S18 acetylase RimI-like enzyme
LARFEFRPATWQDSAFAYALHRSVLRQYVELSYGPWDEMWQQRYFEQHFQPEQCQVVTSDGEDVGMACVLVGGNEIQVRTLEVLPEHQRKGIGTFVLQSIRREASATGKDVTLQVLKVNPARRLYERLGFTLIGETEKHYLMRALQAQEGNHLP